MRRHFRRGGDAMKITDIVLASSSPRRREILTMLGIPFRVVVSGADEVISGAASPEEYVLQAAKRKNEAVLERLKEEASITPDTLIIACDTVVVYNGIVIGKPGDFGVCGIGRADGESRFLCHSAEGRFVCGENRRRFLQCRGAPDSGAFGASAV